MAFRNKAINLTSTSVTDLYTCPNGYDGVVHSLFISNTDAVNTVSFDVSVTFVTSGTVGTFYVGKNLAVAAGTTLIFDKPINLRAGDKISIKASAANTSYVVASILLTAEDTSAPN